MADQLNLIADTAPPDGEPKVTRTTSKRIGPGDIVEVDKKGRRFHALVTQVSQGDSGRYELELHPLQRGISHRQATVRDVLAVWRRAT